MNHNEKLVEIRREIDLLDGQLIALFAARMELADKVAGLKREANLALTDPAREEEVLSRAAAAVEAHLAGYARIFMRSLMELSKQRQSDCLTGGAQAQTQTKTPS